MNRLKNRVLRGLRAKTVLDLMRKTIGYIVSCSNWFKQSKDNVSKRFGMAHLKPSLSHKGLEHRFRQRESSLDM